MKEIATPSTTKYILEKYHLNALKKYGQNFLIDVNIINKIVTSAKIDQTTAVIEVGPGIGALTQVLGRYSGKVTSFEIDERFMPVYQEFLNQDNIEIIFGDFMEQDIKPIVDQLKQRYQKVCLVANLPYYITTAIIEKVVLGNFGIDEMIVMVQKEVALKMTGIYKNVFMPAPHVDSAILKIELKKAPDLKLYEVLNICFKQRRKTILNNLKQSYEEAEEILLQTGIENRKRSEELELADFKNITKMI